MLMLKDKVSDTFGVIPNKLNDLLGVEIELEGRTEFPNHIEKWQSARDGSLKADYSIEYVLKRPLLKDECFSAIDKLFDSIKKENTDVLDTGRAGIHVHLNVGHMTNKQLWTFVTCWFVLEELITDTMAGEGRSGNHFCLRAVDAEAVLDNINGYLCTGDRLYIDTDHIRYSSLNLASLGKFGSLEFRAMRSTTKVYRIKRWLNILSKIKENSLKFDDPQKVVSDFSFFEEVKFLDMMIGERYSKIVRKDPEYKDKMYRGVRVAQEVAYSIGDWNRKEPDKRNPFADVVNNRPEFDRVRLKELLEGVPFDNEEELE
ncbi:MAG: amidoligase family protein [Candidatus Thorarchaeota archaeon]|jgi:hypothetical protein